MYKTSNKRVIESLLKQANYYALPLLGIGKTFDPEWIVDDLEEPKGLFYSPHYFSFLYSEDEGYMNQISRERFTDGFYGFSGTHPKVFEYMKKHFFIHWLTVSSQYHYSGNQGPYDGPYTIESIEESWADEINAHYEYKGDQTLDEILRGIKERPNACIRIDGKLASWVLLHDDYSIGFMYTKPEYRELGLGRLVSQAVVQACVDKGITPFLQIVHGNHKSEGLAQKSGFTKHADVYWFGIIAPGLESIRTIQETFTDQFNSSQPIQYISSYGLSQLVGAESRYIIEVDSDVIHLFENGDKVCCVSFVKDQEAYYLFNETDYIDWYELLKALKQMDQEPYISAVFSSTQTMEGIQSLVMKGQQWTQHL